MSSNQPDGAVRQFEIMFRNGESKTFDATAAEVTETCFSLQGPKSRIVAMFPREAVQAIYLKSAVSSPNRLTVEAKLPDYVKRGAK